MLIVIVATNPRRTISESQNSENVAAQKFLELLGTLENVKGEFESFGELPSERETTIENRNSPLNCVSRK